MQRDFPALITALQNGSSATKTDIAVCIEQLLAEGCSVTTDEDIFQYNEKLRGARLRRELFTGVDNARGPPPREMTKADVILPGATADEFIAHHSSLTVRKGSHFQRKLTVCTERKVSNELFRTADSAERARLISCKARSSALWLAAVPTRSDLVLSNHELVCAARHRLGLPPSDVPFQCVCGKAVSMLSFDHFHLCPTIRSSALNARHRIVLDAYRTIANRAGVFNEIEHRARRAVGDHTKKRPDIWLCANGVDIISDVAITTPSAIAASKGADRQELWCAAITEQSKIAKYKDVAAAHGRRIIPFVAESYGAFGIQLRSVINLLSQHWHRSAHANDASFAYRARQSIAIAIQRGNARVVDVAVSIARSDSLQRARYAA